MTTLIFTNHAIARCQQRGITRDLVELILQYGDERYQNDAAYLVFVPQSKIRALKLPEKISGIGVLIKDNVVITVKHLFRRISCKKARYHRPGRES